MCFTFEERIKAICIYRIACLLSTPLSVLPSKGPLWRTFCVWLDRERVVLSLCGQWRVQYSKWLLFLCSEARAWKRNGSPNCFSVIKYTGTGMFMPLPKSRYGNQFVSVMWDWYNKITNSILASYTIDTIVLRIFTKYRLANFEIMSKVLTISGHEFVLKFFVAVFNNLGVRSITTIDCNLQMNDQAENFNSILISRFRYYVSEHQTDWDKFLLPHQYTYILKE